MACDAFIGLGSNLGDRVAHLAAAVRTLRRIPGLTVTGVSPAYRTAPVLDRRGAATGQPEFLNAAVRARTALPAGRLVRALLRAERVLGRRRRPGRGPAARTVDLDLLLLGGVTSGDPVATVPHARMHARAFALQPVLDLAPAAAHPVLGVPLRRLLERARATQRISPAPAAAQRRFRLLSAGAETAGRPGAGARR